MSSLWFELYPVHLYQVGSKVPVKWGWGTTLLHMPQDILPDTENIDTLFCKHVGDEAGVVVFVGLFIHQYQTSAKRKPKMIILFFYIFI